MSNTPSVDWNKPLEFVDGATVFPATLLDSNGNFDRYNSTHLVKYKSHGSDRTFYVDKNGVYCGRQYVRNTEAKQKFQVIAYYDKASKRVFSESHVDGNIQHNLKVGDPLKVYGGFSCTIVGIYEGETKI